VSGATAGTAVFVNATSGSITVTPPTGALGTPTLTLPTATDTLVGKATSDTFTNKVIDVEGTGNTVTTVSKIWLPAVACSGTTGSLMWDTLATQAPTATCSAGTTETNLMRGVADFADSGTFQMQQPIMLPADFTGAIDVRLRWRSTATSGDVV